MELLIDVKTIIPVIIILFAIGVFFLILTYKKQSKYLLKVRPTEEPTQSIIKVIIILTLFIAVLLSVILFFLETLPKSFQTYGHVNFHLFGTAFAAEGNTNPGISRIIPFILAAVFVIMFMAFSISLWVLLTTPDKAENERRLTAADNVVKTFGGFFIGFATSLLNIG